jgi:hypothetical protein
MESPALTASARAITRWTCSSNGARVANVRMEGLSTAMRIGTYLVKSIVRTRLGPFSA